MKLTKLSYVEREGEERQWSIAESQFGTIGLVVGKNASGKTRTLNVINCIARLIAGTFPSKVNNGNFDISLKGSRLYRYVLVINKGVICSEKLLIDRKEHLSREEDGSGYIYSEEMRQNLKFKIDHNIMAIVSKRDEFQHPFLEEIHSWAKDTRHYFFGSDLGRSAAHIALVQPPPINPSQELDANALTRLYQHAWEKFGEDFDKAILSDLMKVDYACNDVGLGAFEEIVSPAGPLAIMYVRERDLKGETKQFEMSAGMFRCLAIIIHINYLIFSNKEGTILIDDIGEGLDFDRSAKLIDLLISHARKRHLQLLMSTNDRFIMNKVPINYWYIVDRKASKVRLISHFNDRKTFEEFKFLGLSNFDFFSRELYEDEGQTKQ